MGTNGTMKIRNSTVFFCITTMNVLLLAAAALHASRCSHRTGEGLNKKLVRELHLTDLCLFTEARYTRHPAMADNHAPFQEHPTALDHFPSGSLLLPIKRQ